MTLSNMKLAESVFPRAMLACREDLPKHVLFLGQQRKGFRED
jgi:hypothetical protein